MQRKIQGRPARNPRNSNPGSRVQFPWQNAIKSSRSSLVLDCTGLYCTKVRVALRLTHQTRILQNHQIRIKGRSEEVQVQVQVLEVEVEVSRYHKMLSRFLNMLCLPVAAQEERGDEEEEEVSSIKRKQYSVKKSLTIRQTIRVPICCTGQLLEDRANHGVRRFSCACWACCLVLGLRGIIKTLCSPLQSGLAIPIVFSMALMHSIILFCCSCSERDSSWCMLQCKRPLNNTGFLPLYVSALLLTHLILESSVSDSIITPLPLMRRQTIPSVQPPC